VHIPISEADEASIELALHAQEMALPDALIAQLVELQTHGSKRFTASQIRYLLARHKSEKVVKDFKSKDLSSAEKLIESFDKMIDDGEDISYISMIHSEDEGFQLKFPKGRRKKVSGPTDLNITEIRKSMGVNNGQSVLLKFDVTENTNNEKEGYLLEPVRTEMGIFSLLCIISCPMHKRVCSIGFTSMQSLNSGLTISC